MIPLTVQLVTLGIPPVEIEKALVAAGYRVEVNIETLVMVVQK